MDEPRILIRPENPHSPLAAKLITELVDELTSRYSDRDDDEASSFSPADATVPRSIFLVATVDDQPAGCGALRPFSDSVVEIKRMYVRESARGFGVGARLVEELERLAGEFHYKAMILETGVRQPEAIALYTRRGFTRIDPYGEYTGNPLSLCYAKELAPGGTNEFSASLPGKAIAITVNEENPHGTVAAMLIGELSAELALHYADMGDDGSGSFTPADVTVPRSAFVVATRDGTAVGCGAVRPLTAEIAEIKRMYVRDQARRAGVAREIVHELERLATDFGYGAIRLETGVRQPAAIALYEQAGYHRIAKFGKYADNPMSVCFEKALAPKTS